MQRVFNIFHDSKLAGPAAAGKLPGCMLWRSGKGEYGDFLIPRFESVVVANHVAERYKRFPEGFDGLGAGDARGPCVFLILIGPPPIAVIARRPGHAVVVV